ncbi:glycosyltransferase family 2 protein [Thiolapillus brandeum]|uniref:Glycosyltransferase n=1 Tax=Thiolapillus brandeum TaxID=1076588 RepID=A0A7U6GHG1_9GAMM|nr:glycosyltransferase family 2 protein [Thiolapillus brandeum]BAO43682.1 conserved hypothetical protein [Thiolapillus brandeum]
MKIFGLLLVKNEDDIVEEVIADALKWADKIFVVDNCSNDNTWDIIKKLASDRVVVWGRIYTNFQEGLRSIVWESIRHEANEGDWWCFMDADEFYYDNPRQFLSDIPDRYGVVATNTIEFVPLQSQERLFESISGFDKEIFERYMPLNWSESRFFKSTNKLKYNGLTSRLPFATRAMYIDRIKVFHYPLRSAKQIQKRLDTRRNAVENGFNGWGHAVQDKWQEKLYRDDDTKLKSLKDDGLQWGSCAVNFNINSMNFIIRRWVKSIMYYFRLL